jgi:hypothetical protein
MNNGCSRARERGVGGTPCVKKKLCSLQRGEICGCLELFWLVLRLAEGKLLSLIVLGRSDSAAGCVCAKNNSVAT